MEVFTKLLEPYAKVATFKPNVEHAHSFNIDSLVKKRSKRMFDYE
jgi:hypothetical protein